jgi:A/G-specific adenine glycosylase
MKKPPLERTFARLLLKWNKEKNDRQMPWKGEKDPYKIWLSEIILQQTRVEQGLDYYNKFVKTFPEVRQLAAAPDEKVFKLWEGLGYYTRCRNLIATARYIADELKGKFPDTYESIKSLKGIGPYTASAISSFAFNLPHAVVDGNVFRVLSRIFGIATPIDSTAGKKYFTELAERLLDKGQPGYYNQAIMDFGATVCKPVSPLCSKCPFNKVCIAYQQNKVGLLPVKEKKISIKKRWFYYLVLQYRNQIAISQRTGKDIWQGLYEFPLIEEKESATVRKIIQEAKKMDWIVDRSVDEESISPLYKQQLSHQLIHCRFICMHLSKKPKQTGWTWLVPAQLKSYAFPRIINHYLSKEQP